MSVTIAVCDSDREVCLDIRNLILSERPEAEVRIFHSAEELLREKCNFRICFLDIKGIDGMELAGKIRERQRGRGARSIIIFVTGFREHMEDAFDVQAFHYLLKPVKPEKFRQVLECAWQEAKFMEAQEERCALLKIAGPRDAPKDTKKIPLQEILYVESCNKNVVVHTSEGTYEVLGKLSDFEDSFGESFYRSHRCYLVNFAKISSYRQSEITLVNGDRILLAYKKYSAFVKAYLSYARRGGFVNV